nr:hypothetical protein CFP56_59491 [Quercus suber]
MRPVHVILGFKPISKQFQVSKHVIKARNLRIALVDIVVEGFIQKPPHAGTQPVDLPTFKDPQLIAEEILSLNEEADIQSEENEEDIFGESTESLVHDEDFEVFHHLDETEDIASSTRLTTTLVSENQKATQATHVAEEWVDQALYEKKEEELKRYATQNVQA